MNLQPTLENDFVRIRPITASDFEDLYKVASDPLIWEQHPNKTRYKREVFQNFFDGAMLSGGAFLVYDRKTGELIGSSRFYDLDEAKSELAIGYTFIDRLHWGGEYNRALKTLMLDYALEHVGRVVFHIGASNIRSQKAIERLGAVKIGEQEIAYHGEPEKLNFIYEISKDHWDKLSNR